MAKAKTVLRTIPTITKWDEAVDQINFAKGTNIQVVKHGGLTPDKTATYARNQGAKALFHYKNAKGNIGEWYAIDDVTEVAKIVKAKATKNGPVKTTKSTGFTAEQQAKIQALIVAGIL